MTRPGVYVSEAALPRTALRTSGVSPAGAFIGTALKGPTQPVPVSSWSDFVATFGDVDDTHTLPVALRQYFDNGGSEAWVARVLSNDAVIAENIFNDTGGDRLEVRAYNAGAWGNNISYSIVKSATANTFTLTVLETIRGYQQVVERFPNLTMDSTSQHYVESIVNSLTIGSRVIRVTDVTTALNQDDPLVAGTSSAQALTGGSDGTNTFDFSTAVKGFETIETPMVFNIPDQPPGDLVSAFAEIEARGDSVVVIDPEENWSVAQVIAGTYPVSGHAAVYYPWLYIADPHPDAPRGSIRKVPPGAAVVGQIVKSDRQFGVGKAPAGAATAMAKVLAAETKLTSSELDDLSANNINVIRQYPGTNGLVIMGARTRSDGIDRYLSVRRTINYVKKRAVQTSRFALFQPNTLNLWDQLRVANGAFLTEMWSRGQLAGTSPKEAFYVKVDGENNTPQTMANGEVHIEIGIAPTFPAEFIIIRVGHFESDAGFSVQEV